jgi:CRP-like cAMP-binding protein
METRYLENAIANHPFWAGLNPRFFHLLNECATFMRFGANQLVFKERNDADHFYLIHKGQVALETFVPGRGNITIQTLGPGDALGWSWLFPPYQWHFTGRTLEPSELVAFGAVGLRERAEENRDFGHELLTRVAGVLLQRLQATRRQLIEFYGVIE